MNTVLKTGKTYLPKYLVYFQIIYICFVQILIYVGLPSSLTLLCDAVNVFLVLFLLKFKGKTLSVIVSLKPYFILLFLFFLFGSLTALFNNGKLILWLWSIRNYGRFVVYFTSVLVFFELSDFKRLKKIIYVIGHISFICCLYQFFILKLKGDFIGGVFGTTHGVANTWLNVFLVVIYTFALTDWMCIGIGGKRLIAILLECITVAVIGELKFFFIEMVLITLICFILVKKTYKSFRKQMVIILLGVFAFIISIPILYNLFPFFRGFFDLQTIIKTASDSYTGMGDLGRTTAVFDIASKIFDGDPLKVLFGIGLGNGEYSERQSMFQSAFYLKYKSSSYYWFSDAIMMVQSGLVGIVLYICKFFYLGEKFYKKYKNNRLNELCLNSIVLTIISIFLYVYNISLNCEIAYLIYAVIAMGFVDLNTNDLTYRSLE